MEMINMKERGGGEEDEMSKGSVCFDSPAVIRGNRAPYACPGTINDTTTKVP